MLRPKTTPPGSVPSRSPTACRAPTTTASAARSAAVTRPRFAIGDVSVALIASATYCGVCEPPGPSKWTVPLDRDGKPARKALTSYVMAESWQDAAMTADQRQASGAWQSAYERSLRDPEGFWGEASELVDWISKPRTVLDASRPPFYRWFTGGVLNTCYNAVDRHVIAGRADQPAIIHDSPVTGT